MDKKNIKIILIIVIVILMIVGILGLVLNTKNSERNEKKLSDYSGINEEDTSSYTNSFDVCYNEIIKEFDNDVKNTECENYVTIKSKTNDIKIISTYNDKYIFYIDDNKVKTYNHKDKKTYIINIPSDYYEYNIAFNDSDELLGIIYSEGRTGLKSFYSFDSDKTLYDKRYNIMYVRDNYIVGIVYDCYQGECEFDKVELLDSKNEKVIISETKTSDDESIDLNIIKNGNNSYAVVENSIGEEYETLYKKIYSLDGKLVIDFSEFRKLSSHVSISNDGNIYVVNGTNLEVYDNTGKLIKTQNYNELLGVLNEYILIEKDNNLIITTIDGEETVICRNDNIIISDFYVLDNIIHVDILDSSVSIDDIWNHSEYIRNYYTKEQLSSSNLGYKYEFNIGTKELSKEYSYFG